jgi:hypothetical protein
MNRLSPFSTIAFLCGLAGMSLAQEGPKSTMAKWYKADPSRKPEVQFDATIQLVAPTLEMDLAALRFALLYGPYWDDARWKQDVDIHDLRRQVADILQDSNLRFVWNPKQVMLLDMPEGAWTAAAQTFDENTIQFNQIAFYRRLGTVVLYRTSYEIAQTVAHELVHVWGLRNGIPTPDGLARAGMGYDFENLLSKEAFVFSKC